MEADRQRRRPWCQQEPDNDKPDLSYVLRNREDQSVCQCHREVEAEIQCGVLEPFQAAPLSESCELEMRRVLPLSAGPCRTLESFLCSGKVQWTLKKTRVNPSPASPPGTELAGHL
ncbi:unnamed protein product [Boreogadus saida]